MLSHNVPEFSLFFLVRSCSQVRHQSHVCLCVYDFVCQLINYMSSFERNFKQKKLGIFCGGGMVVRGLLVC